MTFAIAGSLTLYVKPVQAALVAYSNMEHVAVNIYMEPNLQSGIKDGLLETANSSRTKVAAVFGEMEANPYLIYVESPKVMGKYAENPTGQTYYPWNNNNEG